MEIFGFVLGIVFEVIYWGGVGYFLDQSNQLRHRKEAVVEVIP